MPISLILGGTRSGKSRRAEALAVEAGRPVTYIATAVQDSMDEEMRARVEAHRARRPSEWRTVEDRMDLANVMREEASRLLLMDCLSLWVAYQASNGVTDAAILEQLDEALGEVRRGQGPGVIVVAQETGMGLVPMDREARRFRDLCGEVNQRLAREADAVELMAAGIPLSLKGGASK